MSKKPAADLAVVERPTVTGIDEQCDQVEVDFGILNRRLTPILINAITQTQGTEGATLAITIAYKPGGAQSRSRLAVTGKVTIPGGGFEHEVAIRAGDGDDPNQLVLFTDGM